MGLRINTNVASINAQRNATDRSEKVSRSFERLSSGLRINRASDDAAGLAIAKKIEAKTLGFQQAKRNSMDAISMVQTAEGGLNESGNILSRLRELAVQAASDTIGNDEREFLHMEYDALVKESKRIAEGLEFNGIKLLSGADGNPDIDVMDFQVGIGNNPDIDRYTFNPNDADARPEAIGIEGSGVSRKEDAQNAIAGVDKGIMAVAGMRAKFGALQNRLQSTIRNISISVENMSSAQSRVLDADIALETSNLAKDSILTEASTSVLAQANRSNAVALKLIG